MSALGEGILELINLSLDIISKLSEISLTCFSFRVKIKKSRILGGSEFVNSLVCVSLEISNFGGEVSGHSCLHDGRLFFGFVDKVVASVDQVKTEVIDVVIELGKRFVATLLKIFGDALVVLVVLLLRNELVEFSFGGLGEGPPVVHLSGLEFFDLLVVTEGRFLDCSLLNVDGSSALGGCGHGYLLESLIFLGELICESGSNRWSESTDFGFLGLASLLNSSEFVIQSFSEFMLSMLIVMAEFDVMVMVLFLLVKCFNFGEKFVIHGLDGSLLCSSGFLHCANHSADFGVKFVSGSSKNTSPGSLGKFAFLSKGIFLGFEDGGIIRSSKSEILFPICQ